MFSKSYVNILKFIGFRVTIILYMKALNEGPTVLTLLMLETEYSSCGGQYHVYWCPGS